MTTAAHRALAAAILFAALARRVPAQTPQVQEWPTVPPSCLGPDGKPPRMATLANIVPRRPFMPWKGRTYYPEIPEHAWQSVKLATEMVANHARARLGARDGELPALDSTRRERDFRGYVVMVGRRDGSIRVMSPWEMVEERIAPQVRKAFDTPGTQLLLNSVDDMVRANEPFEWPERKIAADSVVFMLEWAWPLPRREGGYRPMPYRHGAGVAPLIVDVRRAPVTAEAPRFILNRYPSERDTVVSVSMTFVVDSLGRVDRGGIRDHWPERLAAPTGRAARDYAAFLREATRAIAATPYEPAYIGGCRVAVPVRLSFPYFYDTR